MIIALQYWQGDEAETLALARLLADLEREKRDDVILYLCRRADCSLSLEAERTANYCSTVAFETRLLKSSRQETGHPDGCFGLWAGTAEALYQLMVNGVVSWTKGRHVFFCERDGGPVRVDWLNRLLEAHTTTTAVGKRITGAMMDWPFPHVNGNLVMDLQLFADYPSLRECPPGVAWDLHHGPLLLREARDGHAILNVCGSRGWLPSVLKCIGTQTAWLHGVKDDSLIKYIRRNLLNKVMNHDC